MVERAAGYRWSSAAAHLEGADEFGVLDLSWWQREGRRETWAQTLGEADAEADAQLRRCTYAGRPCGTEDFLEAMSARFGRSWVIGRPRKKPSSAGEAEKHGRQLMLSGGW